MWHAQSSGCSINGLTSVGAVLGADAEAVGDLPLGFRTIDYMRDWLPDSEGAMRKTRFTDEQMVAIIREGDREPVSAVAKRHGISEQTIYRGCPA